MTPLGPSILNDDLKLKQEIQLLSSTKIRNGLDKERIRTWLKQFSTGPEYSLALLILRHLIYRTNDQIQSSLGQALRKMALHFVQNEEDRERLHWRSILAGGANLQILFGPPSHDFTRPGKSGELIVRMLKNDFRINKDHIHYPSEVTVLQENERYLLVDDAVFTGEQLEGIIQDRFRELMNTPSKTGIVVSIAHETAITRLGKSFPNVPIFCGERMTVEDSFMAQVPIWVEDGKWAYDNQDPIDVYKQIVESKAKFKNQLPFGFGELGLMVAYEHGIPDDSLQLLWDESDTWKPLFDR